MAAAGRSRLCRRCCRSPRSLAEAFQDRRYVDLVGFVIAGQHIHDEVDTETHRHLALSLATRHARKSRPALVIDRPGASPVVAADDDAGNAVIDAILDRLDPHLSAVPSAGKF